MGAFVLEVLSVMVEKTVGDGKGVNIVTFRSNSLPGLTSFSSALNDGLTHLRSDNVIGSSRLLTMRNTLVSLVGHSLDGVNIAMAGVTSIGFHMVPVIWRTTFD